MPVTVGMCRQCLGPLGTIGAPAPVGLRQLGCDVRRAWRLASKDVVVTAVLFVEARITFARSGIVFAPEQHLQAGGREMLRVRAAIGSSHWPRRRRRVRRAILILNLHCVAVSAGVELYSVWRRVRGRALSMLDPVCEPAQFANFKALENQFAN